MPAQIDKPILPALLYRYRAVDSDERFNQELAAIKEGYLWCSHYRELNDPMEGFYEASQRLETDETYRKIAEQIRFQKLETGICCFSDTPDNELMWTHYADRYAGLCVAYDARKLVEALPDTVHIVRQAYDTKPPRLGAADKACLKTAANKVLSHKKSSWLYEREWRVLAPQRGKLATAPGECVTKVLMGSRIPDARKAALLAAAEGTGIKLKLMHVRDYTHEFVDCA